MVTRTPTRRSFCIAAAAFCATGPAQARSIVDLAWSDLLPEGSTEMPPALRGVLEHDEADIAARQPRSSGVRTDWNGQTVRMNGFIVPLDYDGTGVIAFMLVPYVGACVHVPPPPANQLVFVTSARPYESQGLFEPVTVTGKLTTAATRTQLADVGYALTANRVEAYRG